MMFSKLFIPVLATMLLSGCGHFGQEGPAQGGEEPGHAKQEREQDGIASAEPVRLTVHPNVRLTEEDFQILFKEPVRKKYPNLELSIVQPGKGSQLPDLIASGDVPDILVVAQTFGPNLEQLQLTEDMSPYLKSSNIDLARFEPKTLDAITVASVGKKLWGLPYAVNFNALFYNKNLFDKFGVPYPRDGLTWDEVLALAKLLSRTDGGVQYRGLDPDLIVRLANPLSLTFVDPNTGRSSLDSEPWRRVFELGKAIYDIPGNMPANLKAATRNAAFFQERTLAMLATVNIFAQLEKESGSGLDWDLAQYPAYPNRPGIYGAVDEHVLALTRTGKHKQQAAQIIALITSDAVQAISARKTGRLTPLKNNDIKRQLGAEMPFLQGKHLEGIFKSEPAPYLKSSSYENLGSKPMNDAFEAYLSGGTDLNSALRIAAERHNQAIEETKKQ